MKRLGYALLGSLAFPAVAFAQSPESRFEGGIGFGVHQGEFGGATSKGVVVVGMTWLRLTPFAAIRGDLSLALNTEAAGVCIWTCPAGAPEQIPALGAGVMIGPMAARESRPYVVAGVEWLFNSLAPVHEAGGVTAPKVGVGFLKSNSLIVEVSGRWRSRSHGYRLRHWVVMAGWYR